MSRQALIEQLRKPEAAEPTPAEGAIGASALRERSLTKGPKALAVRPTLELPSGHACVAISEEAAEPELSGDDTCSTNASDDEHGHERGAQNYGFDFDALPDDDADWGRCCSYRSAAEESVGWMSSFSRCVTEQMEDVGDDCEKARSGSTSPCTLDFEDALPFKSESSDFKASSPTCEGCGFDFDDLPDFNDLPASPATLYEPKRECAVADDDFARERQQTCADGFGFDFDDLPPIPGTTATPTASNSRCSTKSSVLSAYGEVEERPLQPVPTQRRTFQGRPLVSSPGRRVAVVLNGSQGDVQPMVALARQLEMFRHQVKVFTTINLTPWCRERGLDAVPVFADLQAVMHDMGGIVADMKQGLSMGSKMSQSWVAEHKNAVLDVEDALEDFDPEAVVTGIQALGVCYRYESKTGVPVIPVYLSYDAFVAFQDYASIAPTRPSILALSTFLESRTLENRPQSLVQTEEFVLHEVPSPSELEDGGKLEHLRRFLCSGKPPVVVGWGSMIASGMKPVEMLGLALRALRHAGTRGLILGGWADLDKLATELKEGRLPEIGQDAKELAEFATQDVFFINSVPHEWLFPQCSCVVQHGGVGTWQAAVRAGKPTVVTPIFADQFSHSATIERMGLGIGFKKPLQQIEPQELANAITRAEAKSQAAEAVGQKMRVKVGERDAASIINDYLRRKAAPRTTERSSRRPMAN